MDIMAVIFTISKIFVLSKLSFASNILHITGVTSLYDLCPYTNYCTKKATKNLHDDTKTPCCGFCSCADDCWERGNCCADKQNIVARQPIESCVEITGQNRFHGTPRNLPRYYVIQSCPTVNHTLTEKCSENRKSSIDDFIWVTDVKTNKIYNNKYCAACHGVVNYTKWQIATDCLMPLDGETSLMNAFNNVINTCTLFNVPPENTDELSNRCFVPDFSTCNETFKWPTYDPSLETACHSFEQLYIHQYLEYGFQYSFRNVYCFLCNFDVRDHEVNGICEAITSSALKTDFLGFTAILDVVLVERHVESRSGGAFRRLPVCPSDEIKDPFQVLM